MDTPVAWGSWLQTQLTTRQMRPIDLVRRSGGEISSGTISQWLNRGRGAEPDTAVFVAELLDADPVAALRAAGHQRIVNALAASDAQPEPPPDPVIAMIDRNPNLTTGMKATLVRDWLESRSRDADRVVETMRLLEQAMMSEPGTESADDVSEESEPVVERDSE